MQRDGPAELGPDRRRDQMGCRALRHHPLGDPPGHRGLVVAKCQTALCSEVVDPPGEPGVADSREGENRAELLVRPALLPGHAPPLDTQTAAASPRTARGIRTDASPGSKPRTPPAHAYGRAPRNMPPVENTSKHSVVLPIPTVKGQASVWRDCCPCGPPGPRSGVRGPGGGVLLVCGRAPGRALWPGPWGRGLAGYRVGRPTALDSVGWGIPPLHSPRAADRSGR